MKAMRFVLMLVFLFTFVSPVQAQAGVRYGFIPLVKKVNPDLPLWVQSQVAFDRLFPQLMSAQQNGTILEFEPELSMGVVKIKYVAGANELTFGGQRILDNVKEAVALIAPEPVEGTQPETYAPLFEIMLWGGCVRGLNVGYKSSAVISVQDQAGVTLLTDEEDAHPVLSYCFRYSSLPDLRMEPGYKLTIKIYNSVTGALRGRYQVTIPAINFKRVDKKNSVVNGTGPAGKPYSLFWWHWNPDDGTSIGLTKKKSIAADGTWQIDFGTQPMLGGDGLTLTVKQNINFVFHYGLSAPYVHCQISSNYCISHGIPFNKASVTITRKGLAYKFEGKYDEFGSFKAELVDDTGKPMGLRANDHIAVAGITPYTLPRLDIIRVPGMTTISGFGPPNKSLPIFYWWGVYHFDDPIDGLLVLTNADGAYTSTDLGYAEQYFTFELIYKDQISGNVTKRHSQYTAP